MSRLRSVATVPAFALALTASAVPAVHADAPEWAGFTCGFTSTNDPSGVVQQNPDVQFGEIDCGPWAAADIVADDASGPSPHPGLVDITICGWIQVNNPTHTGPTSPSAHVCGSGTGVAMAIGQISYTAAATDNVYLCTQVDMFHSARQDHQYTYIFDEDDDPSNGCQCALAISAGG